ncbi:extracellular solute-binding protein [Schaalia vaccimaxillae]|uniref:extracellular solute-binding protein n=1 Tax=Schaalia vaccimaxillae TaxID=183916 RepID=UPI000479E058|nr:extracellular solute-binding protein [Schaalia vaccimaxillae]
MKSTRKAGLIILTAFALTGCGIAGGGSTSSSDGRGDVVTGIEDVSDEDLQGKTITLARFFGDCLETTKGVTDISKATTECEAIQILTNAFEAENKWGIKVERLGGATWDSYYDGLNAALASSTKPDVAVVHGASLPSYAKRGLFVAVPDGIGIDLSDATAPAAEAVAYEGTNFAVPFDTHAVISHLNMDLLKQAGLVEQDGTYTMPSSVDELMADAAQFKQATGKTYMDIAMSNDPMASRMWMSLIWQQGSDFIDAESQTASMNSEASTTALEFLKELAEKGYTDTTHNYDASQQAFLRGESGIMFNGVWAVNQYTLEAPFEYQVADAPQLFDTPASWANSHSWAVPVQDHGDPAQYRAAFEFVKYLYEHTGDWAIATGHMAASKTAINSEEYMAAPHRSQYIKTATEYGHMPPRIDTWPAIGDLIQEKLEGVWLSGQGVSEVLDSLQSQAERMIQE